jgi:UDP-N-acetylglucosamine kinase
MGNNFQLQFESEVKTKMAELNHNFIFKRLKSSSFIYDKYLNFKQLLIYEKTLKTYLKKQFKSTKEIMNIRSITKNNIVNIIKLSKKAKIEKNIFSAPFKGENIKKRYFSEEKNHKKLLKYKKLFEENKEKEKRLNIYIQKNNELLLSEDEFNQAYQEIKQMVTKNKKPVKFPICITLGGQPGAGKSNIYNIAKKRFSNNIVELDCDAFRVFHPYYKQIKNMFGKEDAFKTNPFVFKVVDLLIEELSDQKYNLIIESSLNNPNSAIQNGKTLPPKGYKVELHIMATPKDVSWQGTIDRYNRELKNGGSPRAVSKEFHDNVVKNIVHSLDVVIKSGLMSNILIFDRSKKCLYDMQKDKNTDPCLLLFAIINGYLSKNNEIFLKSSENKLTKLF